MAIALAVIVGGRRLDRLGMVGRHRQVERRLAWQNIMVRYRLSMTTFQDPLYTGYRYPADLISYAGTVNLSSMELRETRLLVGGRRQG